MLAFSMLWADSPHPTPMGSTAKASDLLYKHYLWSGVWFMSESLTEEEREQIRQKLVELELEHRDLDEVIHRLIEDSRVEELKIKRFKKRKLLLKDLITRLKDKLIPDILA